MASKPATNIGLPEGFKSPFKRVQMEERLDDSLACVATLTGRSLKDVNTLAVQFGVPPFGPYFITETKIAALLINLGGLVATNYKDFSSFAELPEVALLLVDYDEQTELGRHIIYHRVPGGNNSKDFAYLIDPASWIDASDHFNTALTSFKPAYYIGVTAKPQKAK